MTGILGRDRPNQDKSWEHTWENEGGSFWPDNGKKWSELTEEEKIKSIKHQMEETIRKELEDCDVGC